MHNREENEKYPLLVAAGIILNGDRVLVARREEGHLAGKWEFPGGKLEPGESPEQCLIRELKEELGVEVAVGDIFDVVYYRYDTGPVLLLVYECRLLSGSSISRWDGGVLWAGPVELEELDFAPADMPVAEKLKRRLGAVLTSCIKVV